MVGTEFDDEDRERSQGESSKFIDNKNVLMTSLSIS